MIMNMKGVTKKVLASFGWKYECYRHGDHQTLSSVLFTFIENPVNDEQKVLLVEEKLNGKARILRFIATRGWQIREKVDSWRYKLIVTGVDGPSLLEYLRNQN
jgi:hypothetical protein